MARVADSGEVEEVPEDERDASITDDMETIYRLQSSLIMRRRTWRLLQYCLLCGLSLALVITVSDRRKAMEGTVAIERDFSLSVRACEVDVVNGTEATLSWKIVRLSGRFDLNYTDIETVRHAEFHNFANEGCESVPYQDCSALCLVTITMPTDGGTTLRISQVDHDIASPSIWIRAGVRLDNLYSEPANTPLRSLSVNLESATITKNAMLTLDTGDFRAKATNMPSSAKVVATGGGSIYLLRVPASNADVSMLYRQPSSRLCFGTDADGAQVMPMLPSASCALSPPAPPSSPAGMLMKRTHTTVVSPATLGQVSLYDLTRQQFDADNNDKLSRHEFLQGMASLSCCGGDAPFRCACEPLANQLLPSLANLATGEVPFAHFWNSLVNQSMTQLIGRAGVGGCERKVTVQLPSAGAASLQLGSYVSERGEVVVTLQQAAGVAADESFVTPLRTYDMGEGAAGGRHDGFRLHDLDVARLELGLQTMASDPANPDDNFIVIDVFTRAVDGAYSYGTFHSRWVYASLEVSLVIDPAQIGLLSLSVLGPYAIRHERVRFMADGCDLEPASEDEVHRRVAAQLYRAIKRADASYTSRGPLDVRGTLVMLELGGHDSTRLLEFPYEGGDLAGAKREWTPTEKSRGVVVLLWTSIAFGLTIGLSVALLLFRLLKAIEWDIYVKTVARVRTVLLRSGLAALMRKSDVLKELILLSMQQAFPEFEKPGWNPYAALLSTLTNVFVSPLHGWMGDTVYTFVQEKMEPGMDFERFVYFGQLIDEYNLFCVMHGVEAEPRRHLVQRRLVDKYDVRIKRLVVARLNGIRWRTQEDIDFAYALNAQPLPPQGLLPQQMAVSLPKFPLFPQFPVPQFDRAQQQPQQQTGFVPAPWRTAAQLADGRPGAPTPPPSPPGLAQRQPSMGSMFNPQAAMMLSPGTFLSPQGLLSRGLNTLSMLPTLTPLPRIGEHPNAAALKAARSKRSGDDGSTDRLDLPREFEILRNFIADRCMRSASSWINMENHTGPNGLEEPGFRPELYAWCRARGLALPDLDAFDWKRALPEGVLYQHEHRVRQVHTLKWQEKNKELKMSVSWFLVESLSVVLHWVLVFGTAAFIMFFAVVKQQQWARIMCPPGGIGGESCAELARFVPMSRAFPGLHEPFHLVVLVRFITYEAAAFLYCSFFALPLSYLNVPFRPRFNLLGREFAPRPVRTFYGIVVFAHMAIICMYVGVAASWLLLASVYMPSQYLMYGAGPVFCAFVGLRVGGQMWGARHEFREALQLAFTRSLQPRLRRAKLQYLARARAHLSHEQGRYVDVEELSRLEAQELAHEEEQRGTAAGGGVLGAPESAPAEIEPVDIFLLLGLEARSIDKGLSLENLQELIAFMQLPLTQEQKDQFAAFADLDGNSHISEKEFQAGWDMMLDTFLAAGAEGVGLSNSQISYRVCGCLFTYCVLLVFIMIGLAAYHEVGVHWQWAASIRAAIVGGCALAVVSMRARAAGEVATKFELDALVQRVMKKQENDSLED